MFGQNVRGICGIFICRFKRKVYSRRAYTYIRVGTYVQYVQVLLYLQPTNDKGPADFYPFRTVTLLQFLTGDDIRFALGAKFRYSAYHCNEKRSIPVTFSYIWSETEKELFVVVDSLRIVGQLFQYCHLPANSFSCLAVHLALSAIFLPYVFSIENFCAYTRDGIATRGRSASTQECTFRSRYFISYGRIILFLFIPLKSTSDNARISARDIHEDCFSRFGSQENEQADVRQISCADHVEMRVENY